MEIYDNNNDVKKKYSIINAPSKSKKLNKNVLTITKSDKRV